jgi:hypothetical protein
MARHLTAEQIAHRAEPLGGKANIAAINRLFRKQDESDLAHIYGRFNVTERAIRRVRRLMRDTGGTRGFEYAYMIEAEISAIVNSDT